MYYHGSLTNITMIVKLCDRESRRDSWFENRLAFLLFSIFPFFLAYFFPVSKNFPVKKVGGRGVLCPLPVMQLALIDKLRDLCEGRPATAYQLKNIKNKKDSQNYIGMIKCMNVHVHQNIYFLRDENTQVKKHWQTKCKSCCNLKTVYF